MTSNTDVIHELLNRLLDRYEKSRHAEEIGASARRVLINFTNGDMPSYDIENAEVRDRFNETAAGLKQKGLVDFEWVRGRRRLVMGRIWLVLENIDEAYRTVNRRPKEDFLSTLRAMYDKAGESIDSLWIRLFIDDRRGALLNPRAALKQYEKDENVLSNLLKALSAYDKLHGETVSLRAFSIMCAGDSKYFENNMEAYFLNIAAQYEPALSEAVKYNDPDRRERLSLLGIMLMSEIYEFAGRISFTMETLMNSSESDDIYQRMDFSPLVDFGAAVTSKTVSNIKAIDMSMIRRVVFIENKTCYEEAVARLAGRYNQPAGGLDASDVLLVNHGGFLTSQRKKFFALLYTNSEPGTEFLHWGDIDMGGFYMHSKLKRVIPPLKPVYMDSESVEKYKSTGVKRDEKYLNRLKEMKENQQFSTFAKTIDALLKYKVTIEQEVFLSDSIDDIFNIYGRERKA